MNFDEKLDTPEARASYARAIAAALPHEPKAARPAEFDIDDIRGGMTDEAASKAAGAILAALQGPRT